MNQEVFQNTPEIPHEAYVTERYIQILSHVALADSSDNIEVYLDEAFELGRSAVDKMIPPDELINIHHIGVMALASSNPDLTLMHISERLTRPLMEMSMAYGLAFRQQMENRYKGMINARLEESCKLEAIGTLAAGIGHDFNNLLGSIIGFAEMTADSFVENSPGKYNIQQILNASFRARDLVARMLAFARQGPVTLIAVDVVGEVREAIALLRASLRPSVEIIFSTDLESATILADASQIQQIVMNLCINAADAISDRGKIIIDLNVVRESDVTGTRYDKEPQSICLKILDNGSGIPPETLERVFDPFFTTKAPGKGSGLGLSVVYGIVTGLKGVIQVESSTRGDSQGTEFKIVLPLLGIDELQSKN
jgi:signal transduction histidine kinase